MGWMKASAYEFGRILGKLEADGEASRTSLRRIEDGQIDLTRRVTRVERRLDRPQAQPVPDLELWVLKIGRWVAYLLFAWVMQGTPQGETLIALVRKIMEMSA